jgi:hypothetical protein
MGRCGWLGREREKRHLPCADSNLGSHAHRDALRYYLQQEKRIASFDEKPTAAQLAPSRLTTSGTLPYTVDALLFPLGGCWPGAATSPLSRSSQLISGSTRKAFQRKKTKHAAAQQAVQMALFRYTLGDVQQITARGLLAPLSATPQPCRFGSQQWAASRPSHTTKPNSLSSRRRRERSRSGRSHVLRTILSQLSLGQALCYHQETRRMTLCRTTRNERRYLINHPKLGTTDFQEHRGREPGARGAKTVVCGPRGSSGAAGGPHSAPDGSEPEPYTAFQKVSVCTRHSPVTWSPATLSNTPELLDTFLI